VVAANISFDVQFQVELLFFFFLFFS